MNIYLLGTPGQTNGSWIQDRTWSAASRHGSAIWAFFQALRMECKWSVNEFTFFDSYRWMKMTLLAKVVFLTSSIGRRFERRVAVLFLQGARGQSVNHFILPVLPPLNYCMQFPSASAAKPVPHLKHSQIHLKSTRPMPRLFSWICSQHILAPLDPAFILMQVVWRVILRGHLWQKVLQHYGCKLLKLVAELKIWVVGRPWVLCLPSTFFWEFIELLK